MKEEWIKITFGKRKGMETLRAWCISEYKRLTKLNDNNNIKDIETFRTSIDVISEILRSQYYSTTQHRPLLNLIRTKYILRKY